MVQVRAGTGGDEAALFAGDLLRMYERASALHGWKFEVNSAVECGTLPGPVLCTASLNLVNLDRLSACDMC